MTATGALSGTDDVTWGGAGVGAGSGSGRGAAGSARGGAASPPRPESVFSPISRPKASYSGTRRIPSEAGTAVNTATLVHMSDIEPRRRGGASRRARADRAYTLTKVAGGLLVLTIVLFLLAVFGVVSGVFAVVAGALTVGSGMALRRTLNR